MFMCRIFLLSLFVLTSAHALPTKKINPPKNVDPVTCGNLLVGNEPIRKFEVLLEEVSFDELLTGDPAKNLAVKHPTIVMNAAQRNYQAIRKYGSHNILSPTYPVPLYEFFPIFSSGVPEAEGQHIIGQYRAIQAVAHYIRNRAIGLGKGDGLQLAGPAGTGKTAFLNILDRVLRNLSMNDPDFYQYTFRFKDLDKIPRLRSIVADDKASLFVQHLSRSPLTLLPLETLKRVVALATPRVRDLLGTDPIPWTVADPITKSIIAEIVRHYGIKDEASYIDALKKHVTIVRRVRDLDEPPHLMRYSGKFPDTGSLFMTTNISLREDFGSDHPFAYRFNGLVPRSDGGLLLVDEYFRNVADFRNTMLEVGENGVLQANGSPGLLLDIVPIYTSNDESIDAAREEGQARAQLDRLSTATMRQPIHPILAQQTALYMVAEDNFGARIEMRDLQTDKEVPGDFKTLYPDPTPQGELRQPEGRFAVWVKTIENRRVLIAPHTLEMLGLVVAGTRLVTDPQAIAPFSSELNLISPKNQYFTDVAMRLQILTREHLPQNNSVYVDLDKLLNLLREGMSGISARDAKRWLKLAIDRAANNDNTLTPTVLDQALEEMLESDGFADNAHDTRSRWIVINNTIKAKFILPSLTKDIRAIVTGDTGVTERIYDTIKREVSELNNNDKATEWVDPASRVKKPIDLKRLEALKVIFRELYHEDFTYGKMVNWHFSKEGERWELLMRAIEHYVAKTELSLGALTGILEALDGENVSAQVRELTRRSESTYTRLGYNRTAFREALRFVTALEYKLEQKRKGQ